MLKVNNYFKFMNTLHEYNTLQYMYSSAIQKINMLSYCIYDPN